jgi:formate--tetrahydrofolate ligase
MLEERPRAVRAGADNLRRHIEIVRAFGVSPVIAVNAFPTDAASELEVICEVARQEGVRAAISTHVVDGGQGARALAQAVVEACAEEHTFTQTYQLDEPLRDKIDAVATQVYGADGVDYSPVAAKDLERFELLGYGAFPVVIAKTHLSISSDPRLRGDPRGWRMPVREVRAAAGAGYVYAISGDMRTMPGLPRHPAAERIDLDESGEVVGLF